MRQQTLAMAANVHDKHPLPGLLHGAERRVYGDSACASQKVLIEGRAPNAEDFTNHAPGAAASWTKRSRSKNRNKSRIRSRVAHVFGVLKRLWDFGRVRSSGVTKNATRAFAVLALDNIYLSRQPLMAQVRP